MQSQTMSLSQTQQLQMVLAPQLRQSLEMLQVPILELRAIIQQEIELNPTIEEVPLEAARIEVEPVAGTPGDGAEMDFDKEFESLSRLDEEWRDYFFQNLQNTSYTAEDAEKRQFLLDSLPQRESLQEHLVNQLNLSGLSEPDRVIGELIIGSLGDDGLLTTGVEDLAASAGCDVRHLEDILSVIQDFHPTGVGARDLRECLLIQLERMDQGDSLAAAIIRDHLEKLAGHKIPEIARALKVTIEDVKKADRVIKALDPRPGRLYSPDVATYVLPEVAVRKLLDGGYAVVLNDEQLPHVRISKHYRDLLSDTSTTAEVKSYVRERIRSGAFLIKSIHQRQRTIHRIASEIVARQTPFLDNGISHLRPMTMAEVAAVVGVHETTVSRAVSGKYIQTPKGLFEMKYFFTPGIRTTDGQDVSNETVKDMIARMVVDEDSSEPLSDQAIMERLKEKGIKIARRTIAKYRLVLRIPPSHMRKSY